MQRHGMGRLVKKRVVGLLMAGFTGLTVMVAATIIAFPVLAQQEYAATRPAGAEGSMPGLSAGARPTGAAVGAGSSTSATRPPGILQDANRYIRTGCRMPSLEVNYVDGSEASYLPVTAKAASNWNFATLVRLGVRPSQRVHIIVLSVNSDAPWVALYEPTAGPPDCTGGTNVVIKYNRRFMDNYDFEKRVFVATHELGHALGLADLDFDLVNCPVPVLYYSTDAWDTCRINTPQIGDIAGIKAVYNY